MGPIGLPFDVGSLSSLLKGTPGAEGLSKQLESLTDLVKSATPDATALPSGTVVPTLVGPPTAGAAGGGGESVVPAFGEMLSEYFQEVDSAQHRADEMVESLALGEPVDVHQVMLALNQASNAMQLTLQVRGKLIEAYQELMRIQI